MVSLIHVSIDGALCHFQMFVNCLFSQTWSNYEMAVHDSLQKSILCRNEHGLVQVFD
jgi:hypothetical protein